MQRKQLVVVQPPNLNDSKLGMQNTKIVRLLKEAPIGVDNQLPHTVDLIDVSRLTNPRG